MDKYGQMEKYQGDQDKGDKKIIVVPIEEKEQIVL